MNERALDVIYAGPIGNNAGGFYAINLKTGQQIKQNQAIILPTTQAAIDRVQELATKDKMNSGLTFGDGIGKTTINDITTTENTEDDDTSIDNYSVESDFTEVSISDTMVDDDDDESTLSTHKTPFTTHPYKKRRIQTKNSRNQ